jgi:hypothetical protein
MTKMTATQESAQMQPPHLFAAIDSFVEASHKKNSNLLRYHYLQALSNGE